MPVLQVPTGEEGVPAGFPSLFKEEEQEEDEGEKKKDDDDEGQIPLQELEVGPRSGRIF